MYSIDQVIFQPPFSAIISILLILGCDLIGFQILKKMRFFSTGHNIWLRWQAPVVGAMFLALILYPLALANFSSRTFMQITAFIIFSVGFFHFFNKAKVFLKKKGKLIEFFKLIRLQSYFMNLLFFILFGTGLVAMGPPTAADSLDYHLGVALSILNNGGMPNAPEWFLGRLAGNGEVLNALGLSIGAEQFGSLLQYVSLIGIVGMFLFVRSANNKLNYYVDRDISNLISLSTFSAPVLLFLTSSSKPQMWPIAMTTLAFVLVIHPSRRKLSHPDALFNYTLISLLIMTAMQAKFNYLLGGSIVGILALIYMVQRRLFWCSILISLATGVVVLLPSVFWKMAIYNVNLINAMIQPLPGHLPGTDIMISHSQFNPDTVSNFFFPLSILIPSKIGGFSATLGVGWLLLIGIKPNKDLWLWAGLSAAVIMIIVNFFLAPPAARMFLEPYFWLLFILLLRPNVRLIYEYVWLKWIVLAQAGFAIAAVCYGVLFLFPGAISSNWRTQIMERSANGYDVMKWADGVLPKDAILLNFHRSMALSPRDSISSEWMNYVNIKDPSSSLYLERLKSKKVSHALLIGAIDYTTPISNCFGKVFAGPGIGHLASRNPFNQGDAYEVWIVEFEWKKLPECAIRDIKFKGLADAQAS